MKKSRLLGVLACMLTAGSVNISSVSAATLSPNEILRIEFTYTASALIDEDTFFYAGPNWSSVDSVSVLTAPSTPTEHKLYDEGVLLGTYSQDTFYGTQFTGVWAESTSLFTFQSPTIADLSSIADGTTNGYIEIKIDSGLLDIDLATYMRSMTFGEATGTNSTTSVSGALQVTDISIISAVPIPAAIWLFGSGLLGLIGLARQKNYKQ